MVLFIRHRVNILDFKEDCDGVECDIRDGLVMTHDHVGTGVHFSEYIKTYPYKFIILNVKCEGLEKELLKYLPEDLEYFFLDSSFPTIVKLGNPNMAVRFSEYERMDTLRTMKRRVKWVWVDLFHSFHFKTEEFDEMKQMGYSICLVSPELHGRFDEVKPYAEYIKKNNITPDAVCTKCIDLWKEVFP